MNVAIVAAVIDTIQPTMTKPVKKMSIIELNNYPNDDDYTVLRQFERNLKEEYKCKDFKRAGIIVHANIVMRMDVNPEASADEICTDILLDNFFEKYMGERKVIK